MLAVGTQSATKTFAAPPADDKPVVVFDTTLGKITIELDRAKAPISVENFLKYVDEGFYDKTIFHRVISDFMIQGGGFTDSMQEKPTHPPIKNEAGNGLSNVRGTIAMARTNDPNSATSQFYFNRYDENAKLDNFGGGYAVFGKVIDGLSVVDAIAQVPTGRKSGMSDVPVKPVYIKSAKRKAKS
ncbi:peptidylprolyl isomerase [Singulisphaera rosea]